MMVTTPSLRAELTARGFRHIRTWSRGVDLAQFKPEPRESFAPPRPIFAYVGRFAVGDDSKDVLISTLGCLDADLRTAALHADRTACRAYAETFTWRGSAETFLSQLLPSGGTKAKQAVLF